MVSEYYLRIKVRRRWLFSDLIGSDWKNISWMEFLISARTRLRTSLN